ncbi:MAG: hypothetical protein KKD64_06905 [Alphaproteobacteria bacterium]|nr:hypothetical protein [Alphaproteobacteria bacterium]MBU0795222.1 hypothetical protein [Alphaproteobacteria bacterium]MBU0876664.1 hypothetical protein [Alphaproteobacteria bacterium]MBU1769366.1 hypothetical protein [Alphaproteobacteria bacterium]
MKYFGEIAATAFTIGLVGAALTGPALAHHSFAMFDQTKKVSKVSATVAEFRFTNPHSFVVVNVEEGSRVTRYVLECSSVNMMRKGGWKFNTIKAGDKVDIIFFPLRNGKPGGMLNSIKVPDGRTLAGW